MAETGQEGEEDCWKYSQTTEPSLRHFSSPTPTAITVGEWGENLKDTRSQTSYLASKALQAKPNYRTKNEKMIRDQVVPNGVITIAAILFKISTDIPSLS